MGVLVFDDIVQASKYAEDNFSDYCIVRRESDSKYEIDTSKCVRRVRDEESKQTADTGINA